MNVHRGIPVFGKCPPDLYEQWWTKQKEMGSSRERRGKGGEGGKTMNLYISRGISVGVIKNLQRTINFVIRGGPIFLRPSGGEERKVRISGYVRKGGGA